MRKTNHLTCSWLKKIIGLVFIFKLLFDLQILFIRKVFLSPGPLLFPFNYIIFLARRPGKNRKNSTKREKLFLILISIIKNLSPEMFNRTSERRTKRRFERKLLLYTIFRLLIFFNCPAKCTCGCETRRGLTSALLLT